jgi:hypothetical protein
MLMPSSRQRGILRKGYSYGMRFFQLLNTSFLVFLLCRIEFYLQTAIVSSSHSLGL